MTNSLRDDLIFTTAAVLVIGLSAVIITTGRAHSADLKTPPVYTKAPLPSVAYSWTGFYIEPFVDYGANFANSVTSVGTVASIDLGQTPHGFGAGGALEALYQPSGSDWVFGVGAEASWADLKANGAITVGGVQQIAFGNATNYLGSVYGIVGYTLDPRLLAYLNGGFGFGGAKPNLAALGTTAAIIDTSTGWKVGGGLKYAVNPIVSVGIEGDYYQLGDRQLSIGTPPVMTSTAKFNIFEQKATLAFKLGGAN